MGAEYILIPLGAVVIIGSVWSIVRIIRSRRDLSRVLDRVPRLFNGNDQR